MVKTHSVKDFNEPEPRMRGTAARIDADGGGRRRKITIWFKRHASIVEDQEFNLSLSFLRKQESIGLSWIPVFTGMTTDGAHHKKSL
jgi:hypothetical protein